MKSQEQEAGEYEATKTRQVKGRESGINLRRADFRKRLGSILITGGLGRYQMVLILHSSKDNNLVLARIPEHSAVSTTVMSRRGGVSQGKIDIKQIIMMSSNNLHAQQYDVFERLLLPHAPGMH